jgi:broad specificity phosphatase PhoE
VSGERLELAVLDLAERHPNQSVVIIGHGGITVDLARNHLGDESVEAMAPGVIDGGIPSCSVTEVVEDSGCLVFPRMAGALYRQLVRPGVTPSRRTAAPLLWESQEGQNGAGVAGCELDAVNPLLRISVALSASWPKSLVVR